jgi:hypothetical protein
MRVEGPGPTRAGLTSRSGLPKAKEVRRKMVKEEKIDKWTIRRTYHIDSKEYGSTTLDTRMGVIPMKSIPTQVKK